MNISPDQLENSGYIKLDELEHKNMLPFIKQYLKHKGIYSRIYYILNFTLATLIAAKFILECDTGLTYSTAFTHLCYGLALAFLLIPLHEFIHVVAYRYCGAQQTSYDAVISKFYFMAIADMFVASFHEFRIVALAPVTVISILLSMLYFIVSPQWTFTVMGILLTHASFCSGDFGLLNYFSFHSNQQIVTYDDKAAGKTYFYAKRLDGQ